MSINYPIAIPFLSASGCAMQAAINDINARLSGIERHKHHPLTGMPCDAAPVSDLPLCGCGCPHTPGTVHRTDGPCYQTQPAAPGDDAAVDALPAELAAAVSAAHDGPISDEQVCTLLHYLRFDAVKISRQRSEIAALKAKLAEAQQESARDQSNAARSQAESVKLLAERDEHQGVHALYKSVSADLAREKDRADAWCHEAVTLANEFLLIDASDPWTEACPRLWREIQHAVSGYATARADLALCESENREKQACIERFMEAEVIACKELARVTAERDAAVNIMVARGILMEAEALGVVIKDAAKLTAQVADLTAKLETLRGQHQALDKLRKMDKEGLDHWCKESERLTAELARMEGERGNAVAVGVCSDYTIQSLKAELAEAKAGLHAANLSVHTWHDAEAAAIAELAEARGLLRQIAEYPEVKCGEYSYAPFVGGQNGMLDQIKDIVAAGGGVK